MDRKKIMVVNLYPVFPPNNGGQLVIWGLYKNLARWFDIEIIDFTETRIFSGIKEISDYLKLTSLFKSKEVLEKETIFYKEQLNSFADPSIPTARYLVSSSALVEKIKTSIEGAELVITDHPYTFRLIKKVRPNKKIWYRAQNVEFDYRQSIYANLANKDTLTNEIYQIEKECCEGSELILTITEEDSLRFQPLYNAPKEKILCISAGYEWETADFTLPSQRNKLKTVEKANQYDMTAFFISSRAESAIWSAKRIIDIAKELSHIEFIIAGSVGNALKEADEADIPDNVVITGVIGNEEKEKALKSADVALHLIEHGSGMNIKVLEYFAFGLPVISTKFGIRGLNVKDGQELILTDQVRFKDAINSFCKLDAATKDNLAKNARAYLVENFTWRDIAEKVKDYIKANNGFEFDDNEREISQNRRPIYSYCIPDDVRAVSKKLDEKVFIWGTGSGGIGCLKALTSLNKNVAGFIDNDSSKWDKRIEEIPIISPSYLGENFLDSTVIIASMYIDEIYDQLLNIGIDKNNILIYHMLENYFIYPHKPYVIINGR